MSAGHVVVTPGATGADGISAASRLVVRALASVSPVAVLSAAGPTDLEIDGARVAAVGADGSRARLIATALGAAASGSARRHVVCLHAHLSPVARLLAGARGRLTCVLFGVEAWRPLSLVQRRALAGARLVAISAHTRDRFAEANPSLATRPIAVCHLGVPEAPPAPTVAERGAPFALIVARMASEERYKGHDELIDVWPRVAAEVPGAKLVIAGDGDDRARLERRAAPLDGGVEFAGHVSTAALDALYRRAAFFAMPSRGEGFGLVYLEAMRAARACIGAPGAAAEIIESGVTGCLVDPSDRGALGDTIVRLFRDPATCERLGRAGAARVAERFTEPQFRRRFLDALEAESA